MALSRPEAGFVGLSVVQAKGIDAFEAKMPMSIDTKAMIIGETEGTIKLVTDKAIDRIIGVHFLADHTDTLIGTGVIIVAGETALPQVTKAIFPHPTQTELFGEFARRLLNACGGRRSNERLETLTTRAAILALVVSVR